MFVPAFNATTLDDEVGHVQRFTKATLKIALLQGGFSPHRLHYFDCLGFPAALAIKLLERIGLFQYSGGTIGLYDRYVFPVSKELDRLLSPIIGKNVIAVAR